MTHVPHDLTAEFPTDAAKIRKLQSTDSHFEHLLKRYAEANHAVYRAEARLDAVSEEAEAAMRRKRLMLKDEISRFLSVEA